MGGKKGNTALTTGWGRNFSNATKGQKLEVYIFKLETRKLRNIIKENQIPVLLTLFHKIETEGRLQYSFYEAIITLIPKPQKGLIKK